MKETAGKQKALKISILPNLLAEFFNRLKTNRLAFLGLAIVLFMFMSALLAPLLSPHDPLEQHLSERLASPSRTYLLGTDDLGRCIFSRILYGARVSLFSGLAIVAVTAVFGTVIGLLSGFSGGVVDEMVMRMVDVFLAFPGLILALVIAGLLGPGLFNVMLALSVAGWARYARVVRGCTLAVKEMKFVEASIAIGNSNARIVFRHILPEVLSPVIVMATLGMGWTILSAAALSFLGIGAQPPMPEWGSMLNSGRVFIRTAPHLTTFPGLAIMAAVLGFNFLGDGLRDALDPKNKQTLQARP